MFFLTIGLFSIVNRLSRKVKGLVKVKSHFNKSVAKLIKPVNLDMKNLTVWLNANKISLNVDKT